MLSVRSSSIVPASGSTVIVTLIGMPSGAGPNGSWQPVAGDRALRHLRDHVRDAPLGVVEPLLDELRSTVSRPYFAQQLLEPRLADPRRADHREVVAVPLVGHADPPPAHADDVVDVLVVALDAHGREDQAPSS